MRTQKERSDAYKALEATRRTRCSNVRTLRDRFGGWTALGRLTGHSDSFLLAIAGVNPTRSIGEVLARDIERSLKLSPGWLDADH